MVYRPDGEPVYRAGLAKDAERENGKMYFSIAGGRKTMALFAMAAAQFCSMLAIQSGISPATGRLSKRSSFTLAATRRSR